MFIPLIKCPTCGHTGRPGEVNFNSTSGSEGHFVHCSCGTSESGKVGLSVGRSAEIKFSRKFDVIGETILVPYGTEGFGFYVKELYVGRDKMRILSSIWTTGETVQMGIDPAATIPVQPVEVGWSVCGLVDTDRLPTWRLHFYSAIIQHRNGLYRPSLLDYAVSFEVFLEAFLREKLTAKLGETTSDYLVRKVWRVEERAKELLELSSGKRFSDRSDVYQPWDEDVRQIRNRLSHGEIIPLSHADVEKAHQAVYQAIRWVSALQPAA